MAGALCLWYGYKRQNGATQVTAVTANVETAPAAISPTQNLSDRKVIIFVHNYICELHKKFQDGHYKGWGEFEEFPVFANEMKGMLIVDTEHEPNPYAYKKLLYLIDRELYARHELLKFVNQILDEAVDMERSEKCINRLRAETMALLQQFNERKLQVNCKYQTISREDADSLLYGLD